MLKINNLKVCINTNYIKKKYPNVKITHQVYYHKCTKN